MGRTLGDEARERSSARALVLPQGIGINVNKEYLYSKDIPKITDRRDYEQANEQGADHHSAAYLRSA